jgi:hypothetical protein
MQENHAQISISSLAVHVSKMNCIESYCDQLSLRFKTVRMELYLIPINR